MSYKKENITFAGLPNLNVTSDATSDVITMMENYIWSVSPNVVSALTGSPTYTIQASSDGNTWFNYTTDLTDVNVTTALDVEGFGFPLMKVVLSANGASAGIISFVLSKKLLK